MVGVHFPDGLSLGIIYSSHKTTHHAFADVWVPFNDKLYTVQKSG